MKVRKSFVSNSSSSSYIIEFNQPIDSKVLSGFSQLSSIQSRIDEYEDEIRWTTDYLIKNGLKDQIPEDEDIARCQENITKLRDRMRNSVIFTCERGSEIYELLDLMIVTGTIAGYEREY